MRSVAIYMEGGGSGRGRNTLRRGMDRFLAAPKERARSRAFSWKLVCCGSREDAYRRLGNAVAFAEPHETVILLVDAEDFVVRSPRAHLREEDNWDLSFASENTVHLMTQIMETWLVADPEGLARYYGGRFNPAKLPRRMDLEQEPKTRVENGLRDATKDTGKGPYHNIEHASELLGQIDPAKVRARCRHCKRLFEELDRIIAAA